MQTALKKSIGTNNIALFPILSEIIPVNNPPTKLPISNIDAIYELCCDKLWLSKNKGSQNKRPKLADFTHIYANVYKATPGINQAVK